MTRLYTDPGADVGYLDWWNSISEPAGTVEIAAENPRSGTKTYKITGNAYVEKSFGASKSAFFTKNGIYMAIDGTNEQAFYWLKSGGTIIAFLIYEPTTEHIQMWIGADTTFGTKVATTTGTMSEDTMNLMEVYLEIDDSIGQFIIKNDGFVLGSFVGDTKSGAYTTADSVRLGWNQASHVMYLDDNACNSDDGSYDNDWCGLYHHIFVGMQSDDTPLEWFPTGTTHADLFEIPFATGTYVWATGTNMEDRYDIQNLTGSWMMGGVQLVGLGYSTEGGVNVDMGLEVGGSDHSTPDSLPTSLKYIQGAFYPINPTTSGSWTATDFNSMKAFIKSS